MGYHHISAKDQSSFTGLVKTRLVISVCYALYEGGLFAADADELHASEVFARRLNAIEDLVPKKGEYFIFPCADGAVMLTGEREEIRTSTSAQDQFDQGGEDHLGYLVGEADGTDPANQPQTDKNKARNDVWSISGDYVFQHYVQEKVRPYVPKDESFLINDYVSLRTPFAMRHKP